MADQLLPSNALRGSRVGIAVSGSPDLARLGLLETHFKLAIGEIARAALVSGGGLVYGGRTDDYTVFVAAEVQRYARRDRPLLICLAWPEHRRLSLPELYQFRHRLSLYGKLVCLSVDGAEIAIDHDRDEAPQPVTDVWVRRRSFTGLRRYMAGQEAGRVFLGGRRVGFQGAIPGLMEEALMSLRAKHPIYLAGGFGGVALDIARALGVDTGDWLPPDPDATSAHPGLTEGIRQLRALAATPEYVGLANGLTDEENHWLAASHRPGDIASLVSLGLGRVAQQSDDHPL